MNSKFMRTAKELDGLTRGGIVEPSLSGVAEPRRLGQTLLDCWTTRYDKRRSFQIYEEMAAFPEKNYGLRSKMWILPNGAVVGLDGEWHYRWILAHKNRVAEFGLDTTTLPDEEGPVRIAALKRGFFRVSYETRSSNLIFEGLENKFEKGITDGIFMIVMENMNALNEIKVTLFNEDVTEIKSNRSAPLFTLPTADAKLAAVEDVVGKLS
jgi:hypothetical protein